MRISLFLAISCGLHIALLLSMPSLSASPGPPLKKPVWVELVDLPSTQPQTSATSPPVIQRKPVVHVHPKESPKIPRDSKTEEMKTNAVSPLPEPSTPLEEDGSASVKQALPKSVDLAHLRDSTRQEPSFGMPVERTDQTNDEIEYEKYISEIKARVLELKHKVEKNWAESLDEESREGTTVILAFVDQDGSLWSIDILKPSGIILHDYEALEAVKKVFPLRAPPKSLLNAMNKLPVRFDVSYLMHAPH